MLDDRKMGRGLIVAPYAGALVMLAFLAWVPRVFEPVIRDDHARNIEIPENLLHPMKVKAAYNHDTMFFRFLLPTDEPAYYHDYWVYEGEGSWRREGASTVGRQPHGVYEDRITFFVDDGRVPEFGKWGGFVTASSSQMRFFTEAAHEEVIEHPHLGPQGHSDLRKWLPETRTDPDDWRTIKPPEELQALREAGYFLDLWHWRAHRSNPIGYSDDQYILDYRLGDQGVAPWATNWDPDEGRPIYMFDPDTTGQLAMRWEKVLAREYPQEDYRRYALILPGEHNLQNVVEFDPDHDWQAGDVLPRRLLREPQQSRGDIQATGIYHEGAWLVDLWRLLDTGNPLDDKILKDQGLYQVAFAAHVLAHGSRWHYVSHPMTLGLSRRADIEALRFAGEGPPWDEVEWSELELFYPGQIDWAHLTGPGHAGAKDIAAGRMLPPNHTPEVLGQYAVQSEFRGEIRRQWLQTLVSVLLTLALVSAGVLLVMPGRGRSLERSKP